jgi:hypothetical protein
MVLLLAFLDGSGYSNYAVRGQFCHFGCFLSLIYLMIQFIRLIHRVLSPYALLAKVFILS